MKKTKISSPFEPGKTERTAVAVLMHWMREIIEDKNLDLGLPDVETVGTDKKLPDIVIYESRRSQNVLCVIEAKRPYYDVFDEKGLKKPAWDKANQRKAKYFAVTNFKELIWYKTKEANARKPEEEQVVDKYHLSELENINQIEEPRYALSIKQELERFLVKLYAVYTGKESEPKQAIDSWLIYRLQREIKILSIYYRRIIYDQYHKDTDFRLEIKKWFKEQRWTFVEQDDDFNKIARQTAYLLVNKIIFYNVLRAKRPSELDPLEIPEGITKGGLLQILLQGNFKYVLKIDYETIYTTDFIDELAYPESKEVVKEVKKLLNILKQYDFATLGYDIISRIFENLIPANERHKLGQYFTNSDVVDIILRFCLTHETDKIFDPACGGGTFLVRAYQHKKLMNQYLKHEEILDTLWGNDVAKFPAHLATINLAINDLSVDKNYPNIIQEDFFSLLSQEEGFELPEKWRKVRAKTLGLKEREVKYPRWFDAIVGNPPYTRQEEIPEIASENANYKMQLIEKALLNLNGEKKLANISKRAGIHAYFFVHGMKFLKDGGRFGFIVSNSWLDVDYGKGLQEFFLKNYKIIAIIGSKVERWFEAADINTCIVILEKCSDKKERDENLVRFIYLKKPLSHLIPSAKDIWEEELNRLNEIDKLKNTILGHNEFYENEEMRIFPKYQKELWKEGIEKDKYIGAKWGKYIRAPQIFFKILEKCRDKFVPLKEVADVRRGFTTGANEFFYLTEEEIKRRKIEREYLQPIIFSLKEVSTYKLDKSKLTKKVVLCTKDKEELKGTNLLRYIKYGERKEFDKRPTCASRYPNPWYCMAKGWRYAPLIFPAKVGERMPIFLNENVFEDKKLYGITPKNSKDKLILAALLNSTISRFFTEFTCRQLTGAQAIADIDVVVVEDLPVICPIKLPKEIKLKLTNRFKSLSLTPAESIFKEVNNSPHLVSLDKVKPDRRELDKIIMGEILGLTDEEQLEVYRAVIDLVKSRIDTAKSFGNKKKIKGGIDIGLLTKTVMDKIGDETLGKFYKEKILSQKHLYTKKLPEYSDKVKIEKELFGWRLYSGRKYVNCKSESEAHYLKVWLSVGLEKVKVPKDEKYLKDSLSELEELKKKIDGIVDSYLSSIMDTKTSNKILHQLWTEITKYQEEEE